MHIIIKVILGDSMKKFSDFSNERLEKEQNTNNNEREKIENMYNKYSKMDKNSLLNEFIKISTEKRRSGELTKEYVQNLRNNIYPYLNNEQKQYFEHLVNLENDRKN